MNEFMNFVANHWMLWAALVILVGLILVTELQAKLRGIPTLSPQNATTLLNHKDAKIVDIRDEVVFSQGHITGALNVPAKKLESDVNSLKTYQNKPVILVDNNGQQALKLALHLRKQGFTDVSLLQGGITAWRGAGLPVVKG